MSRERGAPYPHQDRARAAGIGSPWSVSAIGIDASVRPLCRSYGKGNSWLVLGWGPTRPPTPRRSTIFQFGLVSHLALASGGGASAGPIGRASCRERVCQSV